MKDLLQAIQQNQFAAVILSIVALLGLYMVIEGFKVVLSQIIDALVHDCDCDEEDEDGSDSASS